MMPRGNTARQHIETVRAAYQAAIDLSNANAEGVWQILNVMLLANTILVGATTLAITVKPPQFILGGVLSALGLLLSLLWLLLVRRARRYADYFVLSARELEEAYLAPQVRTLARGASFADGEEVVLNLGGLNRAMRMDAFSRRIRVERAATFVITAFAAAFLILLFAFAWLPCSA
jgi:cytochrome c biogenesis protein CcdA